MYEVFIGGWGNQQSVIRKNRMKPDKVEVPTPNILNVGEFRTFWIRWDNKTISCGCENNSQPFISWTDTEYVPIRYIGVCTGWGATGSWIVHASGAPLPGFGAPGGYPGAQPGFGQPNQSFGGPGFAPPTQPGQFGGATQPGFGGAPQPGFGGAPQSGFGGAPQPGFGGAPQQGFGGNPQPGQFGGSYGNNNWVQSSGGNVPPQAFVGGNDSSGEPLYVIRGNFQGALIPGKLVPSHRNGYVPWGGQEHAVNQYEVLCNCYGRWTPCTGGNIPANAISAGRSENGEPLYVGRVNHQGSQTVGKVQRSHNCCYIPYGGQEMSFQQYEILTS